MAKRQQRLNHAKVAQGAHVVECHRRTGVERGHDSNIARPMRRRGSIFVAAGAMPRAGTVKLT